MFHRYHSRPLEIIDTTLREGRPSPLLHDHHKYFLTTEGKRGLLAALIRYGVNFAELVAPVVEAAQTSQPVRVDGSAGVIDLPAGRFAFPPFPPTAQAFWRRAA